MAQHGTSDRINDRAVAASNEQPATDPVRDGDVVGVATRLVGSYGSYRAAEHAVDLLADRRFPVQRAVIIGRGLHSVEQVTGRLTVWGSILRSAASGAVIGALVGWLLGLFNVVDPLVASIVLALTGALIGALLGAAFGAAGYALRSGRRDFTAVEHLQADTYHLLVPADVADQAAGLLREQPDQSPQREPQQPADVR